MPYLISTGGGDLATFQWKFIYDQEEGDEI